MKRLFALLLTVLTAFPAAAQIPSSTSESRDSRGKEGFVEGAVEMRQLALCAMRIHPDYGRSMLGSVPLSSIEQSSGHAITKVMENCMTELRPSIVFSYAAVRGAVAEAFYLIAHPVPPSPPKSAEVAVPLPTVWTVGKLTTPQVAEIVAQDFGECVAASDPGAADALLRTVPRSAQETLVIRGIQPRLGPCLMNGRTYHLDAAALRSYIAQGLYRLDQAGPSSAPKPMAVSH